MLKVEDIRQHFIDELAAGRFVTDKTGVKTIEMIGATFEADEPAIFGKPNEDYIQRELDWYKSKSLYVKDIPGGKQEASPPEIWMSVAVLMVRSILTMAGLSGMKTTIISTTMFIKN